MSNFICSSVCLEKRDFMIFIASNSSRPGDLKAIVEFTMKIDDLGINLEENLHTSIQAIIKNNKFLADPTIEDMEFAK